MVKTTTIAENFQDILEDIASGMSVRNACEKRGISPQTFLDYKDKDQDKKEQYARALIKKAEACIETIDQTEEDLRAKKIDPASARVIIDTEKWKAGKFYPKMYGDKQSVELTGSVGVQKVFITEEDTKETIKHIKDVINES